MKEGAAVNRTKHARTVEGSGWPTLSGEIEKGHTAKKQRSCLPRRGVKGKSIWFGKYRKREFSKPKGAHKRQKMIRLKKKRDASSKTRKKSEEKARDYGWAFRAAVKKQRTRENDF